VVVVPVWLTALVAAMVIAFGLYRIYLSRRSDEAEERARKRGGLYSMPRRRHLLYGIVYLVMGGMLVASLFGFRLW
jgi:hypothetical protein